MRSRSAVLELDVWGIRDLGRVRATALELLAEGGFDLQDPRLLIYVDGGDLLRIDAITRHADPRIFEPAWREEVHLRFFRADPSTGVRLTVSDAAYADERTTVAG